MPPQDPFAPTARPGRAAKPAAGRSRDPALARYLDGLDLDSVDLERTDLDALDLGGLSQEVNQSGQGLWRLLAGGGLLVATLPLQATDTYQLHGQPWWLVAWVAAGLAVVGLDGGAAMVATLRRLRSWAAEAAGGPSAARASSLGAAAWRRWGMLAAGVALVVALALTAPQGGWGPQHGSMGWLVSVVVAITAGLILSRWLIMQGEHDRARAATLPPRAPFVMPSWVKWASLCLLATGAVFALAGFGLAEGTQGHFARTGLGFGVGLGAAIWMANRVDEGEATRRRKVDSAKDTLTGGQKDDI